MAEPTVYRLDEVKTHKGAESLWIVIGGKVFDVTKFAKEHPGGAEILEEHAGRDATKDFQNVGHSSDAKGMMKKYVIGDLHPDDKAAAGAPAEAGAKSKAGGGKDDKCSVQ